MEPLVENAMDSFPHFDVEIKRLGFLRTVDFSTKEMSAAYLTICLSLCIAKSPQLLFG